MALCLLGFRGSGYSPSFIAAMQAVQDELRGHADRHVCLVDTPDPICQACPNLAGTDPGGCTLGGPDHEAHMAGHDREVLRRLALAPGATLSWDDLLQRIATRIRGADLPDICTTCPWLPLGVCRESVDALASSPPEAD